MRIPLLTVAVLLGLVVVLAAPAAAHVELIAADPEDGAVLAAPPAQVVLAFSGPLEPGTGTIEVLAADGSDVAAGAPLIEGERAEVGLVPEVAPGEYTVRYALLAADGHEADGEFTFTLAAAATPGPTPTPSATPTQEPDSATPEPVVTPTASPTPSEPVPTATPSPATTEATATDAGSDLGPILIAVAVVVVIAAVVVYRP